MGPPKKTKEEFTEPDDSDSDSDYADHELTPAKLGSSKGTNKDSKPRKQRQPRGKLIKWTDNDYRQALLGIIIACGEQDIAINYERAGQIVKPTCTGSALQQALLKLRGRQLLEGNDVPKMTMKWPKKDGSGFQNVELGSAHGARKGYRDQFTQTPPQIEQQTRGLARSNEDQHQVPDNDDLGSYMERDSRSVSRQPHSRQPSQTVRRISSNLPEPDGSISRLSQTVSNGYGSNLTALMGSL